MEGGFPNLALNKLHSMLRISTAHCNKQWKEDWSDTYSGLILFCFSGKHYKVVSHADFTIVCDRVTLYSTSALTKH